MENPAAYLQAIAVFNDSSVGASSNVTTTVNVAVANGMGTTTHFVSQNGETLADIDRLRTESLGSPEFIIIQWMISSKKLSKSSIVWAISLLSSLSSN